MICTIISDNDSNGRAKVQHVSNGGQLEIAIEQPTFKANPSHHKWVFARAIYNLASAPQKTGNKGFGHSPKILLWGMCKMQQTLSSRGAFQKSIQHSWPHMWHPWQLWCCLVLHMNNDDQIIWFIFEPSDEGKIYMKHTMNVISFLLEITRTARIWWEITSLSH